MLLIAETCAQKALNRGNMRSEISHKEADFEAFERILHEGLQIHQIQLFSYQLMPNHYHLVLRPLVDGEMSRFMGWVLSTHTMLTTRPADMDAFTNNDTRVFRSKTTSTSWSSVAMSTAMPCELTLLHEPRTGDGDDCGAGSNPPSQVLNCFHPGPSPDCRAGSNA